MIGETVAAISTPKGKGGIAVIRISGDKSADILEKCFISKKSPVSFLQLLYVVSFISIILSFFSVFLEFFFCDIPEDFPVTIPE